MSYSYLGPGYKEVTYKPRPEGNYTADQWNDWKDHCRRMADTKWHNDCEYKREHWGKKGRRLKPWELKKK